MIENNPETQPGQATPPPLPAPEENKTTGTGQQAILEQPTRKDGFSPYLPVWEQGGASWFSAFFKTTFQVLFKPYLTFQQVSYPGAAGLIAYALPWIVLATAIGALYSNFTVTYFLKNLAASCVGFVVSLMLLHLALKVVRADKNGLKATFRASMYLCASYLWMPIPWIGPLLTLVWFLAIAFSVLAASQQVTRMRVLAGLLVYLGIIFCIFLVLVLVAGMAVISRVLNAMVYGGQSPFPW